MMVYLFDSAKRNYQTTYPNGKVLSQAFTSRNQLSSVSYDVQLIANFQYDIGMRETTRGLGNGLTQTTSYRQDNLISQKSVGTITNYSYSYDANKRKTSENDGIMSSLSQTFGYDFENRLTSWSSNGTTLNQSQSWSLSLEGAWNSNIVNGVTENRSFNQTYETLNSDVNLMTHDRKGNLSTNKDGSIYTWDFNNQLSFSTSGTPSVNASYAYDALGRRISKTSNSTVTVFVNSGYQILDEFVSINNSPFTLNNSFVYASYIDDPIALFNANGKYFFHSNQQFSVGAITDSGGNLIERFGYNSYGKPITILDSILVSNEYFFTGRQLDSETGLFYFRARYYDSSLGQFISRDPVEFVDGLNLYRGYFIANGLDPIGLDTFDYADPDTRAGRLGAGTSTGQSVATVYIEVEFNGICSCSGEAKIVIKVTINIHGLASRRGGSAPWSWANLRSLGTVNIDGNNLAANSWVPVQNQPSTQFVNSTGAQDTSAGYQFININQPLCPSDEQNGTSTISIRDNTRVNTNQSGISKKFEVEWRYKCKDAGKTPCCCKKDTSSYSVKEIYSNTVGPNG